MQGQLIALTGAQHDAACEVCKLVFAEARVQMRQHVLAARHLAAWDTNHRRDMPMTRFEVTWKCSNIWSRTKAMSNSGTMN